MGGLCGLAEGLVGLLVMLVSWLDGVRVMWLCVEVW